MEGAVGILETQTGKLPDGCVQVILSLVGYSKGSLWLLEMERGVWRVSAGPWESAAGRNGPGKRAEGDGKTPLGVFVPDQAFGTGEPPAGMRFPWRTITQNSLWITDPASRFYNRWVEDGSAEPDYDSARCERLAEQLPQYEMALNYGYNADRAPHRGSALFLHVWKNGGDATAGCTAVSRDSMLALLRWLDPAGYPAFIQLSPDQGSAILMTLL